MLDGSSKLEELRLRLVAGREGSEMESAWEGQVPRAGALLAGEAAQSKAKCGRTVPGGEGSGLSPFRGMGSVGENQGQRPGVIWGPRGVC